MDFTKTSLETMTRNYMDHHGLHDWSIRIGSARNLAGMCNYSRKQITMSLYLANAMSTENVIDTILHEIAHALAGHKAGHGPEWKVKCLEVGARPERCYDVSLVAEEKRYRWTGICPNHGELVQRNRRSAFDCARCGHSILWKDNENPNNAPKAFGSAHETKLAQLLEKYNATLESNAIVAPKGFRWADSELHYLDLDSPFYYETDSGRARSKSAVFNIVLREMSGGLTPCDSKCIECA